jgi:hypothetical protein
MDIFSLSLEITLLYKGEKKHIQPHKDRKPSPSPNELWKTKVDTEEIEILPLKRLEAAQ